MPVVAEDLSAQLTELAQKIETYRRRL